MDINFWGMIAVGLYLGFTAYLIWREERTEVKKKDRDITMLTSEMARRGLLIEQLQERLNELLFQPTRANQPHPLIALEVRNILPDGVKPPFGCEDGEMLVHSTLDQLVWKTNPENGEKYLACVEPEKSMTYEAWIVAEYHKLPVKHIMHRTLFSPYPQFGMFGSLVGGGN